MPSRAQTHHAERAAMHALRALPSAKPPSEADAANRALARLAPGCSLVFLTRSEYDALLRHARLPELKAYKGKRIVVTSDG